jgi:hypothetical protein
MATITLEYNPRKSGTMALIDYIKRSELVRIIDSQEKKISLKKKISAALEELNDVKKGIANARPVEELFNEL